MDVTNKDWFTKCIEVNFGNEYSIAAKNVIASSEYQELISSRGTEPLYLVSLKSAVRVSFEISQFTCKTKELFWEKNLDAISFEKCLAFYKNQDDGVAFRVVTLAQSPLDSLYDAIHGVYNPILKK